MWVWLWVWVVGVAMLRQSHCSERHMQDLSREICAMYYLMVCPACLPCADLGNQWALSLGHVCLRRVMWQGCEHIVQLIQVCESDTDIAIVMEVCQRMSACVSVC